MLKPLPVRPDRPHPESGRIVVVASRYNPHLVEPMTERCIGEIRALAPNIETEILHAPGSFEIPFTARLAIEHRTPDAVICLGVILRGETGHADLIAASVSDTLCSMSAETLTPVIHGVLLLSDEDQARERCQGNGMNRGTEAARAALDAIGTARSFTNS